MKLKATTGPRPTYDEAIAEVQIDSWDELCEPHHRTEVRLIGRLYGRRGAQVAIDVLQRHLATIEIGEGVG
jgi:hypothetical protein